MFRSKPNRMALPMMSMPMAMAMTVPVTLGALAFATGAWAAAPSGEGVGPSLSAKANVAESRAVRTSRAIGMDVRSRQGEAVGQVRDLLVNMQTGLVRYVVLSRGRDTAGDDRVAPVPVNLLKLGQPRQFLTYEGKLETLDKVVVSQADWNERMLRDPDRLAQLDKTWGLQRRTAARLVRPASTLRGQQVTNAEGSPLGEVEDLVLHINQAKASYAIVKLGKNASGDEKRVAVPLRALASAASQPALSVTLDPSRLQALKGFSLEAYQDPNDPAFVVQATRHLGAFSGGAAAGAPEGERRR